jgi:hypothetical protein
MKYYAGGFSSSAVETVKELLIEKCNDTRVRFFHLKQL